MLTKRGGRGRGLLVTGIGQTGMLTDRPTGDFLHRATFAAARIVRSACSASLARKATVAHRLVSTNGFDPAKHGASVADAPSGDVPKPPEPSWLSQAMTTVANGECGDRGEMTMDPKPAVPFEAAYPFLSEPGPGTDLDGSEAIRHAAARATEEIITHHTHKTYRRLLPLLYRRHDEAIPSGGLETRSVNLLRRHELATWGSLLPKTPDELARLAGFGEASVRDVTRLAATYAATPTEDEGEDEDDWWLDQLRGELEKWTDEALVDGRNHSLIERLDPASSIAELFPDLTGNTYESIPHWIIPTRLTGHLAQTPWTEFMDMTLGELAGLRAVGTMTVGKLLINLREESRRASAAMDAAPAPETAQMIEHLHTIMSWATEQRDKRQFGDVLTLRRDLDDIPPRILGTWDQLASLTLPDTHVGLVNQEIERLIGVLPDRQRTIMSERDWTIGKKATLEELGTRFGVTRERIRQLESDARAAISKAIKRSDAAPVRDRIVELRRRLGTAMPARSPHLRATFAWAVDGVDTDLHDAALGMLLHEAGPYHLRDGWYLVSAGAPSTDATDVLASAGPDGFLSDEQLADALDALGIVAAAHDAWRERLPLIEVEGGWLDATGSHIDRAYRYLLRRGEPATVEEILEGFGQPASVRSVRQRLYDDERFTRVSKDQIALSIWGLEEYTTVVDAMIKEIATHGGEIQLDDLIERLAARFGVSAASVRAYADRPLFFRDRSGMLSLRDDRHPYVVDDDLSTTPYCHELSPALASWSTPVDHDLLRGSGCPVPEALAGWLGMKPGDLLELDSPIGPLTLSWRPWSTPDISTRRQIAERLGAVEGDWMVLRFRRDHRFEVTIVSNPSMATPTIGLVAELMGLPAGLSDPDALDRMAGLFKIPASATDELLTDSIHIELTRRREHDLVELFNRARRNATPGAGITKD